MNMKQKYFWILGVITVIGIILISSSFVLHQEIGGEGSPMRVEFYKGNFSVSDEPILNRTIELVFTRRNQINRRKLAVEG